MNGKVLDKLPFLSDLSMKYNLICLQEHFVMEASVNLLKFSPDYHYIIQPARKSSNHRRPSGGLPIISNSGPLSLACLQQSEHFQLIKCEDSIVANVYLPTNHNNIVLEQKFAIASKRLRNSIKKVLRDGLPLVILGDFNCNIEDSSKSCAQVLLSSLPNGFKLATKNKQYSFISLSQSVSNIDHAISYNVELPTVQVGLDRMYTGHLPLSVTIPCT
jgi:exonuclease III